MKQLDWNTIENLSEEDHLRNIELAESEYNKVFKKYQEYSSKVDHLNEYLYNIHYQYMIKYMSYKGKYIKIDFLGQLVYMHVNDELLELYITDDKKHCYMYKLVGDGIIYAKDGRRKFIYPEGDNYTEKDIKTISYDGYNIGNDIKVTISNDKGQIGPRKPEDVEIITEEEYKKVMKSYLEKILKEYYESN